MTIHPTVQALIEEIGEFRSRTGISVTAFGKDSVGDGGLIKRLERGHSPTVNTIDRIRTFMRKREKVSA